MTRRSMLIARWGNLFLVAGVAATCFAQRPSIRATAAPAQSQIVIESADATPSRSNTASGFTVEQFSPTGRAFEDAAIVATFSEDVITSEALENGKTPERIFSIEPAVEGKTQWDTLNTVKFIPVRRLRPATDYVVHVNPQLRSSAGNQLSGTTEYRFQTPPLEFFGAQQNEFTDDRRIALMLEFSDKVKPQDLLRHVTLMSGRDPVGFTPQSDVASAKPVIMTDPMTTDALTVIVEPGLTGTGGPLPLPNRMEKKVALNFRLTPVSLQGSWDMGRPRLVLKFSDYIAESDVEKHIEIAPPVENISYAGGDEGLEIYGKFQPETRYSVTVKQGLRNYRRKLVLEDATLSTWMPPMAPFLQMPDRQGYLGTQSRMKLQLRTGLIDRVTVTARRVYDNNLPYFTTFRSNSYGVESLGAKVAEKTYDIPFVPNEIQASEIDLRDLLGENATGIYSVEVRGHTPHEDLMPDDGGNYWARRRAENAMNATALINLSNLGIVSKTGAGEVGVFVAALDTAQPLAGIEVQVFSRKNQLLGTGTTDANGYVTIGDIPMGDPDVEPAIVVARAADNTEISVLSLYETLSPLEQFDNSGRDFIRNGYEVFLTTERGAYRPGETVHVSGFIRGRDSETPPASFPVQVILQRSDDRRMTPVTHTPTESGLLHFDLEIPAYAPTGAYTVLVRMPGETDDYAPPLGQAEFLVEEFVPNRVKIDATAEDRRFSKSDPVHIDVKAEEMFGQPIANRPVSGVVSWSATPFAPSGWNEFTFGDQERKFDPRETMIGERTLGQDGRTSITVKAPTARPPAALQATVQVTVRDGGRGVTRKLTRTVDPVDYYLGIRRAGDTWTQPGEVTRFEVVSVNPGGELATTDATLTGTISRVKWNSSLVRSGESYSFRTNRVLEHVSDVTATLAAGRATVEWTPQSVGNYLVRLGNDYVSVSDQFYVSSPVWTHQPWSMEKPESVEVVPDKSSYNAGETARLLLKAPFPGTVLLTIEQDRVLTSSLYTMTENTLEIPVPLTESMLPNVYAVASVIRSVQPAEQWLPHRAVGMAGLTVTTGSRVLDIALQNPEEVRPGTDLTVVAEIRDRMTSQPVSGDVIIWAVDEGILTLTDFDTPAPGDYFSAARRLMVQTADFFSRLMPDLITGARTLSATGGGDMDGAGRLSAVPSERIKPVILWQGPARAEADGRVSVTWRVPEFMGRLRIMAMAADGKRFGNGEAVTYVRNPIMVKEHLPRFAAPGDKFQAGFTVYNNTDAPMDAALAVAAGELFAVDPATTQSVDAIAPRDQATVLREIRAAAGKSGQADVIISAAAGAETFGTTVTIPVRPASPRVRISESAMIKAGESATVEIPGRDFLPDTTTVTLVVGSTPDLELAGALTYNVDYPHGCSEQIVSGLFPLLYLADLADATDPGRFNREGLRHLVQQGIDRVLMAQTASGGISMWIGERYPWSWASAYTGHFLIEAEKAGYQVNPQYKNALLDYLAEEIARPTRNESTRDLTQRAYNTYVLLRSGRKVYQRIETLREVESKLTPEARALLASCYLEAGMDVEAKSVLAATSIADANTTAPRQTGGTLSSPVRETAIYLLAHLEIDPDSAEVAGLVRRLLDKRKNNRWGSTQENSFAMLALGRYAREMQSAEPASGTVTVGGTAHAFTTSEPLTLSRVDLAGATVEIRGDSGNAYAWWSAEGVPANPPSEPVYEGITLTRRYLDRDGSEVDRMSIRQGDLVVVELTVPATRELDNVIIQDLLPAGLEIENPRLATSEVVNDEGENESEYWISVARTDIRDDRIIIYGDIPRYKDGKAIYKYTARAVTPGEFIQPPALVEVMYDPAITARTAPGNIRVEAR